METRVWARHADSRKKPLVKMACSPITPVDTDQEINCTLCMKPCRYPKLMLCLPVFCYDCLENEQKQLENSTHQRRTTVLCPTCSEETPLPIWDLPNHVYLRNQTNAVPRIWEPKKERECENCDSEEEACAFCPDCGDSGLRICKQCV